MSHGLYNQYSGKTKFEQLKSNFDEITLSMIDEINKVRDSYDIDNNSGEQLDVIGAIVNQSRDFTSQIEFDVIECNTDGDYECGDIDVQCSTLYVSSDNSLNDAYYRIALKSRIFKNASDATIDDILDAVLFINPNAAPVKLIDPENMTFTIEIYGEIDPIFKSLLLSSDIIPRPQGVGLIGFLEAANLVECNTDGLYECGDPSTECIGFTTI